MKRKPSRRPAVPRYDAAAWWPLIQSLRQPRAAYRWALWVAGVVSLEGLPPAGKLGRWFLLPGGALLLRRDPGEVASMQDLAACPLRLGPFLLRWLEPVTPATAARRDAVRMVRLARRESRGTFSPLPAEVPNEGRSVRFGGRLVLSVAADFVRLRCREAEELGRRATWRSASPKARAAGLAAFEPHHLARGLNIITAELEAVSLFVWADSGQLRRWNKTARGVMLAALTRCGWKPTPARRWVAEHVHLWRPSGARRAAVSSSPGPKGGPSG